MRGIEGPNWKGRSHEQSRLILCARGRAYCGMAFMGPKSLVSLDRIMRILDQRFKANHVDQEVYGYLECDDIALVIYTQGGFKLVHDKT
jgi:hypothetical protein